ncbi:MAG TPA: SIS domain-containing protein [Aggregatilineaceae bacterium]|jgi:glucosamine--fructose-6-phosphate aminotransferase (isomerizing)|nr:SIS domain-containing protein [Anaerolineae bacterium]HMM26646.1 SIS domain-containing protein [Aggregatilineaceae bacterium]
MATRLELEIAEQPQVLRRMVEEQRPQIAAIARAIREAQPRYVMIVARGTSDNAARYAQYTLGALAGLAVGLAAPSLTTIYHRTPRFDGALVIGISQSGRSLEPSRVLEEARQQGAVMTLSITNDAESPLAQSADHHIALNAGAERSLAASKTYTAQLMALALLAAELSGASEWDEALRRVPDWMAETFQMNEHTRAAAARYTFMSHCVTLARGFNYCTGFELALKLKELTYVVAEAYSSADFHHGPKAIVQPGFPLIAIAPEGEGLRAMAESLQTFRASGADLAIISNAPDVLRDARLALPIPAGIPEWLTPIVAIAPGQLLALGLSEARGIDVDSPRGLHKVTLTE